MRHAMCGAPGGETYESLRASFSWELPDKMNIGVMCADRHPPDRLALIEHDESGRHERYTFGMLATVSNRLANGLRHELRVGARDRVGIVLPQCVEAGVAHLACYKLGAVALPLSGLFGPEALLHRLGDSEARVVIADEAHLDLVLEAAKATGAAVVCVGRERARCRSFWELIDRGAPTLDRCVTSGDSPALLIYTSGTTGSAKGVLHGHRVLYGHLPGFRLSHNYFGKVDDRFWTPADWAWIGGLMDALIPSWFYGRPVVATRRAKFDPEWALHVIAEHAVRNVFLPPTALKVMRQTGATTSAARLRTIGCGGEPLGQEVLAWTSEHLGVTVNEFYGQTEANLLIGNCSVAWDVHAGSMGRPYPGHDLRIICDDETEAPVGELGQVAVRAPDPVMFLEYWRRPDQTRAKFTRDGRWLLTGDLARKDDEGYYWYVSRDDDVITSAGYRIGPAEIEACLMRHPAVAMAAAIGVPDDLRGQVVKVFLVLAEHQLPSVDLEVDVREFVKARLAKYLYPRYVEFVDELPVTTTGKIRRSDLRRSDEGSVRAGDQRSRPGSDDTTGGA